MRKVCVLVFSLLIFLSSTFLIPIGSVHGSTPSKVLDLLSSNISFATSNVAAAKDIYPTEVSSDSAEKMNYELPYPGLLPDNPLYFLRIMRDKVVNFLIADPLKKAEFNLLQADKRLNAGIYLFNKGKISLSLTTISKGENYFEEALAKKQEAEKQGMDVKDIERKLISAARKHQEELDKLIKRAGKDFKASFERERKRVVNFQEELKR